MSGQVSFTKVEGAIFGFLCVAIALIFMTSSAFSQVTASAALSGTVTDSKGGVIKGATVTVTNKATGQSRTEATNDDGIFKFDLLPAGSYDVKVNASGFADATTENVQVLVGQTNGLNVALNPGGVSGSVTVVSGETELVSKEKTDISLNITPKDVQDLPLNGRDLANLAYLAPGAKPVDSYDPTKNRIAVFGVNGSSGRNVNVTVNGIDNKDNTVGGPVMQFPLEAIQEFVISTQRFSAVNGRSEGGAVNVVTKSGGKDFHGSAFFQLRDKKLNATEVDPTTQQKLATKPPFNRKIFGGSIGGPLVFPRFGEGGPATHNDHKTFFFFAIERQKEATSIPVAADAFAELSLVQSFPNPYGIPGAVPSTIIPLPYEDTRVNVRIDHTFNSKHNMFVSYNDQKNLGNNDQSGQRNDLSQGNFTKNRLQLANFTLNSALSSTLVNAATVGYQYWNNIIDTNNKVPTITFPTGISFGTNVNVPQQSYQQKYQFKDDLSKSKGNHTLRTGFDYLWERKLGGFFEFNPTIEIDFNKVPSAINALPAKFATAGLVSGMTATSGDPYFDLPGGAKMFGVYFQDDWRFRHNLTLNLGMRWDKDFNLIGASAQSMSRTYLELKAIGSPFASNLPHDDNKDFSPRVGFAWDLRGNGRNIIRGGYGLYFGQTFLNIPLFMIQQARPTVFTSVFSISSGDLVPGTNIQLQNWRFGIDPLPTIPPPPTSLPAGSTGRFMDQHYRNPYTQQWNIGYAHQLNSYSVLEFDYVHVLALHESKTININPTRRLFCVNGGKSCGEGPQDPGGAELASRPLAAGFAAAGVPVLGSVRGEFSVGRSRYDGINVSYRRRLHNRVSVNATYTWSKAVAYNGNAAAVRTTPADPFEYFGSWECGPVPKDTRHRFSMGSVFNLPGGFQIAPIAQYETARPYTAIYDTDVLGQGSGRGNTHAVVFTANPNDLLATFNTFGDPAGTHGVVQSDGSVVQVSNSVRFRNCLRSGSCQFASFDNLRGQPFFQLDTRITKNFRIHEHHNIAAFIQFFDLTNRANFGNNYGGNLRTSSFQKPLGFITPSGVTLPHAFSAELGIRYSF